MLLNSWKQKTGWLPRATERRVTWTLAIALGFLLGHGTALAVPVIDTYVGGGDGDGNLAINAIIDPRGFIAVGSPSSPDFFIADGRNDRVRRVDGQTGLIETVAGNGVHGYSGDGGDGRNASLALPLDVAVDDAGNVYIADMQNNRIRKVSPNGQISTFAGNGTLGYGGDGGAATSAALNNPYSVAVGPDDYIYIADYGNNRIRRVGPPGCAGTACKINTVVGTGAWGFSGDNGPAANAVLKNPADVSFDNNGNMLISDWGNHRIRRVANGNITTIAGGGISMPGSIGDGGPATSGVLIFPTQVASDSAGNIFISDSQQRRIRMVQNGIITTVAGNGALANTTGDGGPATDATLFWTYGVAAINPGTFWLSQSEDVGKSMHNRVRRVTNGIIDSVIGGGLGDGGPAYDARVEPGGIEARPGQGSIADLYFADTGNNVIRYVSGATGDIITLAGTGTAGYGDGAALDATFRSPSDVAVDSAGNVYVADTGNHAVRRISNGVVTTIAGTGRRGSGGDNGPATSAGLTSPTGVAVDSLNRLYIADNGNNRIRRVANGIITTIAGNGSSGYGGDGGPATSAILRTPWDMVIAGNGNIYIADTWNHRIRVVNSDGIISTYAGLGYSGFSGDGGPAAAALFNAPTSIDIDNNGRLYVNDSQNLRMRMIDNSLLHVVTTIAGNGNHGASGDGGPATAASFSAPTGLAVDPQGGDMFISSADDGNVRIVSLDGSLPQPTMTFTATPIPPSPTRTPTFTAPASTPTKTQTPTNTVPAATPTKTKTAGTQSASVFGSITYYSNQQPVSSADVQFNGPSSITGQTNASGNYSATLAQGTWSIEPAKTGGFGMAVSSLDAARVLQSLAGLQRFTSQQRLACDATGDGSISTLDAVYILQFSAGLIDQLPAARMCGSDWLFYPDPATVPNQAVILPDLGNGTCQQGSIVLNPLVNSVDSQNFDGILLGDCTGNWTAAGAGAALRQRTATAIVHAGSPRRGPGNRFIVPIYVKSATPFQAMDLRLRYDTAATFVGATTRGDAADALTSSQTGSGELSLSLASAAPIGDSHGSVLLLQFRGANPSVTLDGALIDEQPARVVTHRQAE